jgi:hypothetical protein
MTVAQADIVDFVAHDPKRDEALLVMVEHRPWSNKGLLLKDLQAKFNTYLAYISNGQLAADFPDLRGKPVHIQLRASAPLGPREIEFLRIVSEYHLAQRGIWLSWKLIGEKDEHGV